METYEITYSNKLTINRGNFENESPMYCCKRIISSETPIDITKEYEEMKETINKELYKHLPQDNKPKIRIYTIDGKEYYSVTSVINPYPPDIPNLELYGLRGTILHRVFANMIKNGVYEYVVSDEEREKLKPIGGLNGFDLEWIRDWKEPKMDFRNSEVEVHNEEWGYAGRFDGDGYFGDLDTMYDLKSGATSKKSIDDAFMQMSAYAKCRKGVEALVILPCHPKAKKEPIISYDVDFYFGRFIERLNRLKEIMKGN